MTLPASQRRFRTKGTSNRVPRLRHPNLVNTQVVHLLTTSGTWFLSGRAEASILLHHCHVAGQVHVPVTIPIPAGMEFLVKLSRSTTISLNAFMISYVFIHSAASASGGLSLEHTLWRKSIWRDYRIVYSRKKGDGHHDSGYVATGNKLSIDIALSLPA